MDVVAPCLLFRGLYLKYKILSVLLPSHPLTKKIPTDLHTALHTAPVATRHGCYRVKENRTKVTPITGIDFDELTPSTYQKSRPLTSSTEARICMVKSDGSI